VVIDISPGALDPGRQAFYPNASGTTRVCEEPNTTRVESPTDRTHKPHTEAVSLGSRRRALAGYADSVSVCPSGADAEPSPRKRHPPSCAGANQRRLHLLLEVNRSAVVPFDNIIEGRYRLDTATRRLDAEEASSHSLTVTFSAIRTAVERVGLPGLQRTYSTR